MQEFCKKCGSLMIPAKSDKQPKLVCSSCGYSPRKKVDIKFREKIKREEVKVGTSENIETLPKAKIKCPECGHGEAYWFLLGTRAADEPETQWYICTKCGHRWREYI